MNVTVTLFLKDSCTVLHEIVRANYMWLLQIYRGSQFNLQQ